MALRDREAYIASLIERLKKLNPDEDYDYSPIYNTYVNSKEKVRIIDREINPETGQEYGEFWMSPSNLLAGKRNPAKRGKRISSTKVFTQDEYIKKAMEVHKGENLDYSQVVYKGAHEKIYIIDHSLRPDGTEYGGYWQEANAHLKGCGHPDKARDVQAERQRMTTEEWIAKAKIVHADDDYDYSEVKYVNQREKVKIFCNKIGADGKPHGYFMAPAGNFLMGKGCPKCGNHMSVAEDEIHEYIKEHLPDVEIISRDKKVLDNFELDIYIPSMNFAIEYNGLKWHSEEFGKDRHYHLDKLERCKAKGINLIQIFEDEYIYHKEIVLAKIGHILGFDKDKPKIMGRKTMVKEIEKKEADNFLDKFHIQGPVASSVYLGCYNKENLIGVMTFKKENNEGYWELTRFATDFNYVCQGVGGKTFSYFIKKYSPNKVKSFLDRRWEYNTENNLYTKLGFEVESIEKPDYSYTRRGSERLHKFGFRKQILSKKYGFPLTMTESEMVKELGFHKIWNCGLIKYVWAHK